MKIIVDENIAFAREAFSKFGNVQLFNGREITKDILIDTDILIIRSITNVNENLLNGTAVKFVGTATTGTDHIDLEYLKSAGIAFSDANGCNADSVAEYFLAALLSIAVDRKIELKGKSIGIIGAGNVGSRVKRFSEKLGLNVLINDPPKERAGIPGNYVSLEEALATDIITFHVPLNMSGIDKTYHLLNSDRINLLKPGTIIINTSRGAVIDNRALENQIAEKNFAVCLDVWENEPAINFNLVQMVDIASAHVAGYSMEGKINGTKLIFVALCKFLMDKINWDLKLPQVKNNKIEFGDTGTLEGNLHFVIERAYDIKADHDAIMKIATMSEGEGAKYFDKLRKEYPLRREFNNFTVKLNEESRKLTEVLLALRFQVKR